MITENIDDLVERVKVVIGRPTATGIVTPEAEERRFIPEALFTGAALFLLHRYFVGFFKPVEDMGVRHGKAAVRLFQDLSKGLLPQPTSDASRDVVQDTLAEAKSLDTPERRAAAEKEIQRVLREHGEAEAAAAMKASEITGAIFGR